jgi:hypothetical protein
LKPNGLGKKRQRSPFFRSDERNRLTHRVRATGAADAMHIRIG